MRRHCSAPAEHWHTRSMTPSPTPTLTLVVALLAGCATSPPDTATPTALDRAVRARPIVLLGEVHDNAEQHALRAAALQRLVDGGARPALLMEQFDRERQADIDRALAQAGATADTVIAAGAPGDPAMQGWNWAYYRPYVALALAYRLPLVAANVSRDDTRRVLKEGLAPLGFDASVPRTPGRAKGCSPSRRRRRASRAAGHRRQGGLRPKARATGPCPARY